MSKKLLLPIIIFCSITLLVTSFSNGVKAETFPISIDWENNQCVASPGRITDGFKNAKWELQEQMLVPVYIQKIEGAFSLTRLTVNEEIKCDRVFAGNPTQTNYRSKSSIVFEHGKTYTVIYVYPVRISTTGNLLKLKYGMLTLSPEPNVFGNKLNKKGNKNASVLASGNWYKMSIASSGIQRVDAELLSKMGLNPGTISFKTIKIYGNGGLMLPEPMAVPRVDDLHENPVYVMDQNSNDRMDAGDYLLFYGQGPNGWFYDSISDKYAYSHHYFSDEAFYFLTSDGTESKKLSERNDGQGNTPGITINTYDFLLHRDFNDKNVIHSGREWFKDVYKDDNIKIANFTESIPTPVSSEPVMFRARLAVRSLSVSSLDVSINNTSLFSKGFSPVSGEYDQNFMTPPELIEGSATIGTGSISINFDFSKPQNSSNVFLDYYEVLATCPLSFSTSSLTFSKKTTENIGWVKYDLNGTPAMIWDITESLIPVIQKTFASGTNTSFIANSAGVLKKFVAFNPSLITERPSFVGKVENQNLHALTNIEYLIISHPMFYDQAKRLGEFHMKDKGYSYTIANPQQIYNEFSSGSPDVTAIRDFIKMFYDRNQSSSQKIKYVLMFGDASFDYKSKLSTGTNFVPTYESPNSFSPAYSYCSDDYFVILDDNEGYWGISDRGEGLDLGIGRIPADNNEEAQIAVDKVMAYNSPISFGDWRSQLTFVGDDEDGNTHFNDIEQISGLVTNQAPNYNINKIYLDAYKQVSFGSGPKYPDVNSAIDASFDRGHLLFNYIGHGGGSGLAHERVVTRNQIAGWTNKYKLPLFITATCQLTQFDNPVERSPGELIFFNKNGGGIALISTSRVVYIGLNSDLNRAVIDHNAFEQRNGVWPTLGEIYRDCKNNSARDVNQRNFILIGDPALILAYPQKDVVTTKINEKEISVGSDTLRALSVVTIEGEIHNGGAVDNSFNGTILPTVFDKFLTYKTLGNDPASQIANYKLQNSVLYRGNVTVEKGRFKFSFVVPKDISYQYGFGKISYYANDEKTDASGFINTFYVGGSSDNIVQDKTGPTVQLFMEDTTFRFGDMVSTSPLLLARVFDENGINTVGNGIGRDIVAILDKNTENEKMFILNNYFSNNRDSYKKGEIRFPMGELTLGRHSINLKIWDSYNNSADAYTEFVIGSKDKMEINSFISYPNPAADQTTFVFNHNKSGMDIKVELNILSTEGKKVYDQTNAISNAPARVEIRPEGYNFLSGISAGMYIVRIMVTSADGMHDISHHKLIIF